MVSDVLVSDQLKLFILFYKTGRSPEWRLFPFVGIYMEPRPSDESLLVGGRISLLSSPHGMGPLLLHRLMGHTIYGRHERGSRKVSQQNTMLGQDNIYYSQRIFLNNRINNAFAFI